MVLALTREGSDVVEPYLEKLGLDVPVGIECSAASDYGVKGIPATAVIDPEGKLVWFGSPYNLSKSTLKDALKGAERAGENDFFRVHFETENSESLAKAREAAEEGELKKAINLGARLLEDEGTDPAVKTEAEAFVAAVEAHVDLLVGQAEALLKRRDVLIAINVYEALGKELRGTDLGSQMSSRLKEIHADDDLMLELEAAEKLERIDKVIEKRGIKKATSKLKALVKKYPTTKAAERAQHLIDQA